MAEQKPSPGILRRNRMTAAMPESEAPKISGPMRKAVGVGERDKVTDKSTQQSARAGEIENISKTYHEQEADTAKAELARLKQRLGLAGLDINSLPDILPGVPEQQSNDQEQTEGQSELQTQTETTGKPEEKPAKKASK